MYTAVMLDIVGSKRYDSKTREYIQEEILEKINSLNDVFAPSLEKSVYFSAGDEIQGLFTNSGSAFMYCRLFKMLMNPVVFRCGIGSGTWDTRLRNEATTAQDGTAYQRARKAIILAEKSQTCNMVYISENRNDYAVNSLLETYYAIEKKQNKNQAGLSLALEGLSPLSAGNLISGKTAMRLFEIISRTCHIEHGAWEIPDIKPFEVERSDCDEQYRILTNTIPWGTISQLVGYTQKSVQNISKTIDSGNTELLRRTAAAIIKMLYNIEISR